MISTRKIQADLFLLLAGGLFFMVLTLDWSLGWNQVSRMAMPLSVVLEGNWTIDTYAEFSGDVAFINGHYYSEKGPLPGLMMIPVIALANLILPFNQYSPHDQLGYANILGAICFSVIPYIITILVVSRQNKAVPHWFWALFFFGSFLYIYSNVAFSHVLNGLLILLSFIAFKRNKGLLSGLLIGAAFCTEVTSCIFGFIWGIYFLFRKDYKNVGQIILGALPFIVMQLLVNHFTTGNMFEFAYKYQDNFEFNSVNYGFTWPEWSNFLGITFSPYRGLFFYAPLLLVLFIFNKSIRQWRWWKSPQGIGMLASIIYILLFVFSKSASGGWAFGPRYLYPSALLILTVLTHNMVFTKKIRQASIIIGTLSLFNVISGKFIIPSPPDYVDFPLKELILPNLIDQKFYPYNVLNQSGIGGMLSYLIFMILILSWITWLYLMNRRNRKHARASIN